MGLALQFYRMLWARRLFILLMTLSALAGGLGVIAVSSKRYSATAKVELGLLKPSVMTGDGLENDFAVAYATTQGELVKDDQVALRAVDIINGGTGEQAADLGADDEESQLRRRVARQLSAATVAQMLPDSVLMEIRFRASTPEFALRGADSMRTAFLQVASEENRKSSDRDAAWYADRAEETRVRLAAVEERKSVLQKETGVIMPTDNADMDSRRLRGLASAIGIAPRAMRSTTSAAQVQLQQTDARILQLTSVLGPSNPTLLSLRQARAALASQVALDQAAAGAAESAIVAAASGNTNRLDEQRLKVVSQRGDLARLNQLQDESTLLREQYNKLVKLAGGSREQAAIGEQALNPVGEAEAIDKAEFPNIPLIVGGSMAMGLVTSMFIALMMELIWPRVRSSEELADAASTRILGVMPNVEYAFRRGRRGRGRLTQPVAAVP